MINKQLAGDVGSAWRPCDSEVTHLVRRLRMHRHARQIRTVSLIALFGVVAFSGHCFYPEIAAQMEVRMPGGYCEHYQTQMEHIYCDHAPIDLDPEFWTHLSKCPDCRVAFKFYLGIGHPAVAHASKPSLRTKRADLPNSTTPISLSEMPGESVLATGR
jgi:hypothetical protein